VISVLSHSSSHEGIDDNFDHLVNFLMKSDSKFRSQQKKAI
jgi:hypothetical protein